MTYALRTQTYMPQISEQDIDTVEQVGKYVVGTGVVGMAGRLLWKIVNKFASGADAGTKKNEAEETLWKRLQDQIEELQQSESAMHSELSQLREDVFELRTENARLRLENEFFKRKVDEQLEIIASLEQMMSNVRITGKTDVN